MKKTLIAMAAVAVAGVASAQVTITGAVAFGFAGDTTTAGVSTSGYGIDGSSLTFDAKEDLGGGLTVSTNFGMENFNENGTVSGTKASLTVAGGFGSVSMSSSEGGDFLPIDGLTANSNGTDADRITYTSPSINGFTLQVTAQDAIQGSTFVTGADGAACTVNDGDCDGPSKATTYAVNYTDGPLSVDAVFADFSKHASIDKRTGVKATYNLGIASVMYGQLTQTNIGAANNTESAISVTVPMEALSLTVASAKSKTAGSAAKSGTAVTASYALSKRTSIAYYNEAYESTGASKVKEYSLLLKHSF